MASADTIALIVAGSGEVSDKEVFDLIEDWYQGVAVGDCEVSLIVPVTKNEYTDAVDAAVKWYLSDEDTSEEEILTVQVEGSNLSRKTSSLGDGHPEKVENFGDIFKDAFEGFNTVYFFVALAKDIEGDFLPEEVEWLEAAEASKAKVIVRNLAAGLDDVILTEPEEPEAEPEPEPEKPARRGRSRRAAEPDPEPEPPKDEEPEEAPKPARKSRARRAAEVAEEPTEAPTAPDGVEVTLFVEPLIKQLEPVYEYLDLTDRAAHIFTEGESKERFLTASVRNVLASLRAVAAGATLGTTPETSEPAEAPETQSEAPSRGRGRPRTNFEERQIWDEDEKDWVKPGRGRLAKGTKWRLWHTEDEVVLDEGIA